MNKLVVICGPTCTGKTSLAIRLCKKILSRGRGEIVSADSRQIYKFMDVGTGKMPVPKTQSASGGSKLPEAPRRSVGGYGASKTIKKGDGYWIVNSVYIHLYDVVEPDRRFSVARFKDAALKEIQSMWRRKKVPFLVGGTGFYIAAVLGEVEFPRVPPDWKLRRELEKLSTGQLFAKLQKLDSKRAKTIDPKNPRRLIRAVEVALAKDVVAKLALPRKGNASIATTSVLKIGLTSSHEVLYQRADAWAKSIVNDGFIDEVQNLINRGYKNTPPMQGIIYKAGLDFIEGQATEEEMLKRIKFDLHGYIRRQLTWFKRDKEIRWFDIAKTGFDLGVEEMVKSYLANDQLSIAQ